MKEFRMASFDNTQIYLRLWDDVDDAKGVIMLFHGMSEYAGRYDSFARYLNKRGYIVFADDHRAHGLTENDKNRGRHKGNIFKKTLKDELFFYDWLKDKYQLPVFVMGHSYGSFLAQAFAQENTGVKAIALLGSGHMRTMFCVGKVLLAPMFLVASQWRPRIANFVSDNIRFKGDSGKYQWVNSVKQEREKVLADPLAHRDMSVGFDFYMMSETSKLYTQKALAKLDPTTAIGIFSGTDDIVGQKGKGVKKLAKMYEQNGVRVDLHLYEGARHEVYYDRCAQKAQKDIADFFDKFIIYQQTSIDDLCN